MTRGRAALLLALVFLAGAAAGAVGMGVASRQRGPGEGLPGRAEQMMVRRIARRLDLDPDQRVILRRVAADTRGQMDDVRQRAVDRVGEILDGAFDQLEPIGCICRRFKSLLKCSSSSSQNPMVIKCSTGDSRGCWLMTAWSPTRTFS